MSSGVVISQKINTKDFYTETKSGDREYTEANIPRRERSRCLSSLPTVPFGFPPMYPSTIAAIPAAIGVATALSFGTSVAVLRVQAYILLV